MDLTRVADGLTCAKRNETALATISGRPGVQPGLPENLRPAVRLVLARVNDVFRLLSQRYGFRYRESFGACIDCSVHRFCQEILESGWQDHGHPLDVDFVLYTVADVENLTAYGTFCITDGSLYNTEGGTRLAAEDVCLTLEMAGFEIADVDESKRQVILRLPQKRIRVRRKIIESLLERL